MEETPLPATKEWPQTTSLEPQGTCIYGVEEGPEEAV